MLPPTEPQRGQGSSPREQSCSCAQREHVPSRPSSLPTERNGFQTIGPVWGWGSGGEKAVPSLQAVRGEQMCILSGKFKMHFTTEKLFYLLRGICPKEIQQIMYKDAWSNRHPHVIKEKITAVSLSQHLGGNLHRRC